MPWVFRGFGFLCGVGVWGSPATTDGDHKKEKFGSRFLLPLLLDGAELD